MMMTGSERAGCGSLASGASIVRFATSVSAVIPQAVFLVLLPGADAVHARPWRHLAALAGLGERALAVPR